MIQSFFVVTEAPAFHQHIVHTWLVGVFLIGLRVFFKHPQTSQLSAGVSFYHLLLMLFRLPLLGTV